MLRMGVFFLLLPVLSLQELEGKYDVVMIALTTLQFMLMRDMGTNKVCGLRFFSGIFIYTCTRPHTHRFYAYA